MTCNKGCRLETSYSYNHVACAGTRDQEIHLKMMFWKIVGNDIKFMRFELF